MFLLVLPFAGCERPFCFLVLLGPRSSSTLVSLTEDDAMEENSSTLPGLPPQPALGTLEKSGERR